MPDWKEIYLHLFRETERAKNIQIAAQLDCEEMYIKAPDQELQVLPKQEGEESRLYVTGMPDYKGMYQHLNQEIHKAVLVLMDAQIQCDAMSINPLHAEIMLTGKQGDQSDTGS